MKTMSFGWFPNNWLNKNKTDKDNKIAEIAELKSEVLVLNDQEEAKIRKNQKLLPPY